MRVIRNALTILALSAVVAIALYGGVEISSAASGNRIASTTASAGQTYLCPVSGCSATSCHGATGQPAPSVAGGAGASSGSSDPGSSGAASQAMTCPRTGCTASTCHGANGEPPPSGGGYGRRGGHGRGAGAPTYAGESQADTFWQ